MPMNGCSFSLLTESMLKDLVPSVVPRMKLLCKHKSLLQSNKKRLEVIATIANKLLLIDIDEEGPSEFESTPKRIKKVDNEVLSFTVLRDKHSKKMPDRFKFPDKYSPLVAADLSDG
uniref:Uncharacterized protein n=1 Tax=Amphimedon queenslandica TaxID=400682 RepID=A0A1X7V7S6_AMPQE